MTARPDPDTGERVPCSGCLGRSLAVFGILLARQFHAGDYDTASEVLLVDGAVAFLENGGEH